MTVDYENHQAPAHTHICSLYSMINGRACCGISRIPKIVQDHSGSHTPLHHMHKQAKTTTMRHKYPLHHMRQQTYTMIMRNQLHIRPTVDWFLKIPIFSNICFQNSIFFPKCSIFRHTLIFSAKVFLQSCILLWKSREVRVSHSVHLAE